MNRNERKKVAFTIKGLPVGQRPYEKLQLHGAESLSDVELLAILLRSGTKEHPVLDVAGTVLCVPEGEGGLQNLRQLTLEQLAQIAGIGTIKAIQLKAVVELSKRLAAQTFGKGRMIIRQAADVAGWLLPIMREYRQEVVKAVFLNTKHEVVRVKDVFVGGLSSSVVHPRELFVEGILSSAAAVVICHNHPSGDPTPSLQDIETTKRLIDAGELLGIPVLDHLVFGQQSWESILPYMSPAK